MKTLVRVFILTWVCSFVQAQTSTPQVIKIQGFLNQSGTPANGTFSMSFTLYDAQFPGGSVVASVGPQSVGVAGGLYEVDLPLASSAFAGSSRYLEITVNGEVLTPRMQMASAPYCYQADTLDGFEGSAFVKRAGDTMTGNLQVTGITFPGGGTQTTAFTPGTSGVTLDGAYNYGGAGAGRTINANAGAVNVAGSSGLSVAGKVGIGTVSPRAKLDVIGDSIIKDELQIEASGASATPILDLDGGFGNKNGVLFRGNGSGPNHSMALRLDQGVPSTLNIVDSNSAPNANLQTGWNALFTFQPNSLTIQETGPGSTPILDFNSGHNNKLGVLFRGNGSNGNKSMALRLDQGNPSTLTVTASNYAPVENLTTGWTDLVTFKSSGEVGIGVGTPTAKLDVAGTVKAHVVQITGADLAEPFNIVGNEGVPNGALVVIDELHPGELSLSRRSYDPRVAGVVSGAGGVLPGVKLGKVKESESGPFVAMAGRVWCLATTSNGPITPGDLLTTSDVPGHAMRASNRKRSHGAVVGKAMSTLTGGDGLVLLLVRPQ